MQDRVQPLFLGPPVPCPTPLCPEVQEPKPPPWPQEGFRGEAPYREPLQQDSLARMELTGKNTIKGLRTKSKRGRGGKRKEICCSGSGDPNFPGIRHQRCQISGVDPKQKFLDHQPTMISSLSTPFNLTSPHLRTGPRGHASPNCKINSVQSSSSCL